MRTIGDSVIVRGAFGQSHRTGTIVKSKKTLFGMKYLIEYGVHDISCDIHYKESMWFSERRLI